MEFNQNLITKLILSVVTPQNVSVCAHYVGELHEVFVTNHFLAIKNAIEMMARFDEQRVDFMMSMAIQIEHFGGIVFGGFPNNLVRYWQTHKIQSINPFNDIDCIFNTAREGDSFLDYVLRYYRDIWKLDNHTGIRQNILGYGDRFTQCMDTYDDEFSFDDDFYTPSIIRLEIPHRIKIGSFAYQASTKIDINLKQININLGTHVNYIDCDVNGLCLRNGEIRLLKFLEPYTTKEAVMENIKNGVMIALTNNKPILQHDMHINCTSKYNDGVHTPTRINFTQCIERKPKLMSRFKKFSERGWTFANSFCENTKCAMCTDNSYYKKKLFCVSNHKTVDETTPWTHQKSQCISISRNDIVSLTRTLKSIGCLYRNNHECVSECKNRDCIMSHYLCYDCIKNYWNMNCNDNECIAHIIHEIKCKQQKCDMEPAKSNKATVQNGVCDGIPFDKNDHYSMKMKFKQCDKTKKKAHLHQMAIRLNLRADNRRRFRKENYFEKDSKDITLV